MTRTVLVAAAAVLVAGGALPVQAAEPQPRLLRWDDIAAGFRGTFAVPAGSQPGTEYRFGYSSGIHGQLPNGHLLVDGHPYTDRTAEVALPAVLDGRSARRVGAWYDVTGGLQPRGWFDSSETFDLGGLLPLGGRIYFTKHQWYNGAGTDWDSQGYREQDLVRGLWNVRLPLAHSQRVGGYLSAAPPVLRAAGVTYLAGQQGQSGAATGRWGPNLFAIDLRHPGPPGSAVPARPLMAFTAEHPAPGWWVGNFVTSVQWIRTPRVAGILVLGFEGTGRKWYGEADEGPGGARDPYDDAKGFHAEGYRLCAWIYRPGDLLAVFRGRRAPWSVRPAATTVLTRRPPGSVRETFHSFLRGPARTRLQTSVSAGRLVVLQPDAPSAGGEPVPRGYVVRLP